MAAKKKAGARKGARGKVKAKAAKGKKGNRKMARGKKSGN